MDYDFYPGELCKDLVVRPIPKWDAKHEKHTDHSSNNGTRYIGGQQWTAPPPTSVTTPDEPQKKKRKKKPDSAFRPRHLQRFLDILQGQHILFSESDGNVKIQKNGETRKAVVLERKKVRPNEETEQDEYFWFLLQPTKQSEQSYLQLPDIDYVAQEVEDGFLLLDRPLLRNFIYDRIPLKGQRVSDPNDCVYKRFGFGRRRETLTLVPREDLENANILVEFLKNI
jgi:hypothetical protein